MFPFSNDLISFAVIRQSANRPLISFLHFHLATFHRTRLGYYPLLTIILSFSDVSKANRDSLIKLSSNNPRASTCLAC